MFFNLSGRHSERSRFSGGTKGLACGAARVVAFWRRKAVAIGGQPEPEIAKRPPLRWPVIQLICVLVVVLITGYKLHGQSCAMCYTTAAGGGKRVVHALQGGIIVLLIPPIVLFSGLTLLLFRWRTPASRRPESSLVFKSEL